MRIITSEVILATLSTHLQVWADSSVDFRCVALDPSEESRMIYRQATLLHYLFKVTVRELIPTVPSHTQKDDCRLEMAPLEERLGLFQGDESRRL